MALKDVQENTNPEPLPPFVSQLLADRAKIIRLFPIRRQIDWRHSQLRPQLLQRVFSFGTSSSGSTGSTNYNSSYFPDNPAASFYRLYQFLVIDWTIQFRNELEYFWGQASWALVDLPDPGDEDSSNLGSEARARKAVMAGLTRIMKKAYNRLISEGLPRDAPPMVDDWEEMRARPRVLEEIPKWAEEMGKVEPVVEIPNGEGKLLREEEAASEDFARYGIRISEPHWVFV